MCNSGNKFDEFLNDKSHECFNEQDYAYGFERIGHQTIHDQNTLKDIANHSPDASQAEVIERLITSNLQAYVPLAVIRKPNGTREGYKKYVDTKIQLDIIRYIIKYRSKIIRGVKFLNCIIFSIVLLAIIRSLFIGLLKLLCL